MKFNFPSPLNAALSCIVLFLFFSCSNDLVDETEDLNAIEYQAKTSQTVTLTPINDAFLQGSRSYNTSIIRLEESKRTGYLMFDLSKIEGEITSANLEFTISSDPGYGTIEAHLGNGSNWTETNLSYNNKPNPTTFLGSINKTYKLGSTEKISLKAESLSADKTTLILFHKNGNDLAFASSKTTISPKLTVTYNNSTSGNVTETDKTPEVDDPNRVNFSKYGAVGDGITDDTKAIQAAFNAEESLVADEGAIFKISSSLKLTQGFTHDINWNGASIITYVPNLTMIVINKKASNGGTTTMKDLLIDAKNKGTIGVAVYSRAVLTNVDGKNYGQTAYANTSPSHIMARYEGNDSDAHGDWIFDGCDAEGLLGYGTECDYLDGIGAANAYLVYWMTVPTSKTTITFKNATIKDSYGPDGQNVGVFSPGIDVSNTLASTIFDNITSSGFERRSWKLFSGNLVIKNCTINNDLASNGVTPCVSAGMIAVGKGSGARGASNIIFENTTFVGRRSGGRDNRVIPVDTHNMHFNNCTWTNGASLAMTLSVNDINVVSSTFESGSSIYEYNLRTPYGTLNLGKDNVYVGFTPSLSKTTIKYAN